MAKMVNSFGGKDGEAQNILMTALLNASGAKDIKDNEAIYDFMEKTPKASFIVELYNEVQELGYEIKKKG